MDIYRQKQNWKKLLLLFAALIIALSFWYTNRLVQNISVEQKKQVQLWAEAIKKKARLVNYTERLFRELRDEERKKVELWVEANKRLSNPDNNIDLGFLTKILTDNTTVPVIWTGSDGTVKASRNLPESIKNNQKAIQKEIELMKSLYDPIEINYLGNQTDYLYYKDSRLFEELKQTFSDLQKSFISEVVSNSASVPAVITNASQDNILFSGNVDSNKINTPEKAALLIAEMKSANVPIEIVLQDQKSFILYQDSWILTQLRYYPFVQFGVVGLFILIGYYFFSTSRRAEQNRVWVGMAKETAHQLGTPLSSLLGWVEYIKSKGEDKTLAKELEKDVQRLEIITDRFSKIGSVPELHPLDLKDVLSRAISYHEARSSKKVMFQIKDYTSGNRLVKLNEPLFNWVIENLVRNAIDAMSGKGTITLSVVEENQQIHLDVEDTGKGMSAQHKKNVFNPGVTSKKRGWGLGLTLSKRIIEEYHQGKIVVKASKIDEGTVFRITLQRA